MDLLTVEKLRQTVKEVEEIRKTQKMLDKIAGRLKNKHKVTDINLSTCIGSLDTIKTLLEYDFLKKQTELENHCWLTNVRRGRIR